MKKKLLSSLFPKALFGFFLLSIPAGIFAQAVGDYGSSATNNAWNTATNWVVCIKTDTWEGATTATTAPLATTNVWIRSGHTVTLPASGNCLCNNLYVEGTLNSASAITSPRYVRLYGNNMTVNGVFGSATDGLGVQLYGGSSQSLTVSGGGTICFSRIQPQTAAAITFDANAQFNYAGSSGAGSTSLYSNNLDYVVTINQGKTITLADNSYFAIHGSSGSSAGSANLTLNVNGTLAGSGANSTINLNSAASKTVTVNIGSTGEIKTAAPIRGNYLNAATLSLNIANGGKITSLAGGTLALAKSSITNNGVISVAGSNADSIGATTVTSTGSIVVNKTASNLAFAGSSTINGALIYTSGTSTLGSNNLTIGSTGSITGTSSSSFIITNGTGKLIQSATAATPKLFPIGASASSYDPVTVTPTSASDFTVGVSSTLSGSPAYGVRYNAKEWSIASSSPSSTVVALTPSSVVESSDPIIGLYSSGAYSNSAATLSGSTFSTTTNTFGSFVTGSNILTTDIAAISSKSIISTSHNQITIQNTKAGDTVAVYTINGQLVKKLTVAGIQSSYTFPSGIYLVKVNNTTTKIVL
jgi:hypothetical protein